MTNVHQNAFPQVKPRFPALIGDDQQPPKPRVIVPLQRVNMQLSACLDMGHRCAYVVRVVVDRAWPKARWTATTSQPEAISPDA